MDVARLAFLKKGVWTAAVRNTSCNRDWMRLLVQSIFAAITVASFILIVIMAVRNPDHSGPRPTVRPRCQIQSCRVICKEAPHFEHHEEHIVNVVAESEAACNQVSLELHNPSFINNTLPENWLPRMRSNIYSLSIVGGNLRHFSSGAFMSQFTGNIKILVLQDIAIKTWVTTSLVGLSSLKALSIIKSKVDFVEENSLRAVDNTLETLTITESGYWDPANFTGFRGFEKLTTVDFSHNDFNEILDRHTFVGLDVTKILYLNFCKITAIGAGAFDYLTSIKVLFLNNNHLVTIPSGLFTNIVAIGYPRPRINLEDNDWRCDCSIDDLRQLVRKEILLVEVKCVYPEKMNSLTFAQFEDYCNNKLDGETQNLKFTKVADKRRKELYLNPVYVSRSDCTETNANKSFRMISHVQHNVCSSKKYDSLNMSALVHRGHNSIENENNWLRLSYFLKTEEFSVFQIVPMQQKNEFGLLWYQSTCPQELYCLDDLPSYLRIYNVDTQIQYTFCPLQVNPAVIRNEYCLVYNFGAVEKEFLRRGTIFFSVILYLLTVLIGLIFGALVVYAIIRQKPTLLKGSKRILFVKHKNVDALVLPPKLPLRNDSKPEFNATKDKDIFTLSTGHKLTSPNFNRMKSVRSNKSGSPSYISAMQPTDDQLAEWRIRHHFNNDLTISSTKSELSTLPWSCGESYYSLDDRTYESLK